MSARTYPRDIWVLTPSYAVKQVTVVSGYRSYGSVDYGDITESTKLYRPDEMHVTKADAIVAGWDSVARVQADIDKRCQNLDKKRANLNKASG